ncbi:MAG: YybH family protein, partial [Croceibacterium sp.]
PPTGDRPMRRSAFLATATICTLLGACQPSSTPPTAEATQAAVTEDEAGKVLDTTIAAWESMDAAKIKALYAPDVAGFDFVGPLVTDRATWDKNQDAFAAAKIDKLVIKAKKIQLLGPDAFVVSSYGDDTSSSAKSSATFRCTDVYKRDAGGSWLVVNENCSSAPHAG